MPAGLPEMQLPHWKLLVPWVRNVLQDLAPRLMMQSLLSMARPSGYPAKRWTNSFETLRLQLVAKGQKILATITWLLWGKQITALEWGLVAKGEV